MLGSLYGLERQWQRQQQQQRGARGLASHQGAYALELPSTSIAHSLLRPSMIAAVT